MPSTRTINETREVTTSYTVTRTYLPVVNHGVAQQVWRCVELQGKVVFRTRIWETFADLKNEPGEGAPVLIYASRAKWSTARVDMGDAGTGFALKVHREQGLWPRLVVGALSRSGRV